MEPRNRIQERTAKSMYPDGYYPSHWSPETAFGESCLTSRTWTTCCSCLNGAPKQHSGKALLMPNVAMLTEMSQESPETAFGERTLSPEQPPARPLSQWSPETAFGERLLLLAGHRFTRPSQWSPETAFGERWFDEYSPLWWQGVSMEPRNSIRGKVDALEGSGQYVAKSQWSPETGFGERPELVALLKDGDSSQWSPETGFGERARVASACAARVSWVVFERYLFDAVASLLHNQHDRSKSFPDADFEAASGAACACATGPLAPWMGPLDFTHSSLLGRVAGIGSCRARRVVRKPVACVDPNIANSPHAGKGRARA